MRAPARRTAKRARTWSRRMREYLRTGHDWILLSPEEGVSLDPMAVEEAWKELGEEIVQEHASRFPGTRPALWWKLGDRRRAVLSRGRRPPLDEAQGAGRPGLEIGLHQRSVFVHGQDQDPGGRDAFHQPAGHF